MKQTFATTELTSKKKKDDLSDKEDSDFDPLEAEIEGKNDDNSNDESEMEVDQQVMPMVWNDEEQVEQLSSSDNESDNNAADD